MIKLQTNKRDRDKIRNKVFYIRKKSKNFKSKIMITKKGQISTKILNCKELIIYCLVINTI